jgi:parallel beta-helix repeat protein
MVGNTRATLILSLILCFVMVTLSNIGIVEADGPIYIRADGSVEGTDRIQRDGNIYTFTGNIDVYDPYSHIGAGIWIQKDDIIIDGVGYSIQTQVGVNKGIDLTARSNVTVKNMKIKGFDKGINLEDSSNNTILGNDLDGSGLTGYPTGLWVWNSSNNNIHGNTITAYSEFGILFQLSNNNILIGNTLTDNNVGIDLYISANNFFRNNQMNGNTANFGVEYNSFSTFSQDIDTSNTVDGKPIYYWIKEHDKIVPSDAGFVVLGNCTNITVQNLKIANNYDSILLYFTNNSIVTNNNVESCAEGIFLRSCQNITVNENVVIDSHYVGIGIVASKNVSVTKNNVAAGGVGIDLNGETTSSGSTCNVISDNIITENDLGIDLTFSNENVISYNYIADNQYAGINFVFSHENQVIGNTLFENHDWGGIRLSDAENNTFHHNNFINNEASDSGLQVATVPYFGLGSNSWDNGKEGNYWSDYIVRYPNAREIEDSGIWDTSFFINENNIDHYPLVGQYVIPEFPSWAPLLIILFSVTMLVFIYKRRIQNQGRTKQ